MIQHSFKVGERVAFAREFLRNTGQVTGDAPFARGVVSKLTQLGERTLVTVKWDDKLSNGRLAGRSLPVRQRVLDCNLWPTDKLHLEPV